MGRRRTGGDIVANTYKLIKRHKNIEYYAHITKVNSKHAYIFAAHADGHTTLVAEVNLKTNRIDYNANENTPEIVKEAITTWSEV